MPTNIVETQANFAMNLLREASLANTPASVIISPISVAIALSMVYVGAKNETKSELGKLLGDDSPSPKLEDHFSHLVRHLGAEHRFYSLNSANRVYLDKSVSVLGGFRDEINRTYKGSFEQVDVNDAAGTAKSINDFVDEATHHKIKEIVSAQDVTPSSRLFLVNAIHFKANWSKQFEREFTTKSTFYVAEGQEKQVHLMNRQSYFVYFEDDQAQVLGLPYEGNDVFMFIILPKEHYGLQKLLNSVDGKKLTEYTGKRDRKHVNVFLPRFKIESSLKLKDPLRKLGLVTLFDKADLSGITEQEPLRVGEVLHKAIIEVNEEGSEAAASTAVQVMTGSSGVIPPKPKEFKSDHAFAYAIVDSFNNVLFFGHVSDLN